VLVIAPASVSRSAIMDPYYRVIKEVWLPFLKIKVTVEAGVFCIKSFQIEARVVNEATF